MQISKSRQTRIIQLAILSYWAFFWLENVIDKFIGESNTLWIGKDRLVQLQDYFASIGIIDSPLPMIALVITTILEAGAFIFVAIAIWKMVKRKFNSAQTAFFWSICFSLATFTFFAIGDQIFGDRVELLEHTIYWGILLFTWWLYGWLGRNDA